MKISSMKNCTRFSRFPYRQRSQRGAGTGRHDEETNTGDHHLIQRSPHFLQRRTSAVTITAHPPNDSENGQDSARWRASGMRASRTTTDLTSLSVSQIPLVSPFLRYH